MQTNTTNGINFPSVEDAIEGVIKGNEAGSINDTNRPVSLSKYALVAYASQRANEILRYNSGIEEGHLNAVGPVVHAYKHDDKPLSLAMREISEGRIDCTLNN